MTARMHACPGGCGKPVEYERLACYPCWWRLPFELRQAVNVTYRNRDSVPSAWHQAVADASAWYKRNPQEAKS